MSSDNKSDIYDDFTTLVNMSADELKKWLATDDAKSVGWSRSSGKKTAPSVDKSIGYESGEKILAILAKKKPGLSEDDYAHMRRVNGYIKRHLGQHPNRDITKTRWRYSLMNWGHDPLK